MLQRFINSTETYIPSQELPALTNALSDNRNNNNIYASEPNNKEIDKTINISNCLAASSFGKVNDILLSEKERSNEYIKYQYHKKQAFCSKYPDTSIENSYSRRLEQLRTPAKQEKHIPSFKFKHLPDRVIHLPDFTSPIGAQRINWLHDDKVIILIDKKIHLYDFSDKTSRVIFTLENGKKIKNINKLNNIIESSLSTGIPNSENQLSTYSSNFDSNQTVVGNSNPSKELQNNNNKTKGVNSYNKDPLSTCHLYKLNSFENLNCIKVSPFIKNTAALGTSNGAVFIYDLKKEKDIFGGKIHIGAVNCIDFSLGKTIITGGEDGNIFIMDFREKHVPNPNNIDISASSERPSLFSQSASSSGRLSRNSFMKSVNSLDLSRLSIIDGYHYEGDYGYTQLSSNILNIKMNKDGRNLISSNSDGEVNLFEIDNFYNNGLLCPWKKLKVHNSPVYGICWSSKEREVFYTGGTETDQKIKRWNYLYNGK